MHRQQPTRASESHPEGYSCKAKIQTGVGEPCPYGRRKVKLRAATGRRSFTGAGIALLRSTYSLAGALGSGQTSGASQEGGSLKGAMYRNSALHAMQNCLEWLDKESSFVLNRGARVGGNLLHMISASPSSKATESCMLWPKSHLMFTIRVTMAIMRLAGACRVFNIRIRVGECLARSRTQLSRKLDDALDSTNTKKLESTMQAGCVTGRLGPLGPCVVSYIKEQIRNLLSWKRKHVPREPPNPSNAHFACTAVRIALPSPHFSRLLENYTCCNAASISGTFFAKGTKGVASLAYCLRIRLIFMSQLLNHPMRFVNGKNPS